MIFFYIISRVLFSECVAFEDLPLSKSHGVLGWLSREAPSGCIIHSFYFTSCPRRALPDERCIVYVICAPVTSSPAVRYLSQAVRDTFIITIKLKGQQSLIHSPHTLCFSCQMTEYSFPTNPLFSRLLKRSRSMGEWMCWNGSI